MGHFVNQWVCVREVWMRFMDGEKVGDILVLGFLALVMFCDVCLFVEASGVRW
ncbi:hypothetical protein LNR78_004417 [Salmonella enterica]|nr:hypothetical protein [Salmonella enterica]EEQ1474938.1 hypothetical protein [Salmonella enterica]EHK3592396.1 hypothetical protein [Salmonella enterica]EHY0303139.1 hypothetical protein [Salmonella enterica]EIB3669332.1 hypothetical protein [Salmonella enterica]